MAKLPSSSHKNNGIIKLKIVAKRLQKSLLLKKKPSSNNDAWEEEEVCDDSTYVPEDVKEGHFAVIAVDGDEPKRFVVPLTYLTHPKFLRLLEQAAEEYGFDHEGALTIPCRPSELERILQDEKWEEKAEGNTTTVDVNWGSCSTTMVKSF